MKNAVQIDKLNFKYKDREIFQNLDLTVKENTFTIILGANGSGKTTLVKILQGIEKSDGLIEINGLPLIRENLYYIYKDVYFISDNSKQPFKNETIIKEISNSKEKLKKINKKLNIEKILQKSLENLNASEKQLVPIILALIMEPKIIIIDEGLNNLNIEDKKVVLEALKKLTKNKKTTVIYMTHNSNDSLYSDNIIILDDKQVLLSLPKKEAYKQEKAFKKAKLELPFIIDLSKKLQFYNLIKVDYLDAEKMVDNLWK